MEINHLNWDEPDLAQIEEAEAKKYELNHQFRECFESPAGKVVLEWLKAHTLDTPTWWPSADYNKSVANGFFREGQNSLIRQMISMINQAKTYKESVNDRTSRKRKS
jgi:hypothetical protein